MHRKCKAWLLLNGCDERLDKAPAAAEDSYLEGSITTVVTHGGTSTDDLLSMTCAHVENRAFHMSVFYGLHGHVDFDWKHVIGVVLERLLAYDGGSEQGSDGNTCYDADGECDTIAYALVL
jgi:hypothetical protein